MTFNFEKQDANKLKKLKSELLMQLNWYFEIHLEKFIYEKNVKHTILEIHKILFLALRPTFNGLIQKVNTYDVYLMSNYDWFAMTINAILRKILVIARSRSARFGSTR